MSQFQLEQKYQGINKRNVTFSHLMAAFLLIIMGAVSATIIRALAETNANIANSKIFYIVSSVYIICGLIILFITIKFNKQIISKKSNSTKLRTFEILLLAPIFIYCVIQKWYVPAAYAGIGILGILYAYIYEYKSVQVKKIVIDEKGVNLPTSKVGFLAWDGILRLIVRHQILTIEANGNKLYQIDLAKNENINTEELEAYALKRIKEEKKLIKNDW